MMTISPAYDEADPVVIYIYDKAVKNRLGGRKNTKRKIRWQERMRDMLDVPLEGLSALSTVQIVGDCEISVTGCQGVLIYMPDRILLRGVSGTVLILGDGLEMHSLSGDRITVCGRIQSVHPNCHTEDPSW